jgi:hypothetical protein
LAWLLLPGHALSEAAPSVVGADSWPAISLQPTVASGLVDPVYVTHANDGTGRLFVLEQAGRIRIVVKQVLISEPFLDITDRVLSGGERGLLGLAFHPNFRENGRLIVNYTRTPDGATVVSEFRVRHAGERPSLSERILIVIAQPYSNHNGGMIAFGPDGLLYIGMGDGGSAGDPQNRAQNPHELLGKMLRIDVDKNEPYAIPGDNPFRSGGGRPEVYAKGLRNPWRFSFDRETGDLWAADVGQYKWEEIDLVTLNGNYGWRRMEGRHCFIPESGCEGPDLNLPLLEYAHQGGRCSITGGYVYRGQVQSSLKGLYLFGDYCSGELFGARLEGGEHPRAVEGPERLLRTGLRISSFGEDEAGELYVVDHGGGLYHVTETSQTGGEHHNFPANQ